MASKKTTLRHTKKTALFSATITKRTTRTRKIMLLPLPFEIEAIATKKTVMFPAKRTKRTTRTIKKIW